MKKRIVICLLLVVLAIALSVSIASAYDDHWNCYYTCVPVRWSWIWWIWCGWICN